MSYCMICIHREAGSTRSTCLSVVWVSFDVLWKGHHRAVGSHGNYNVCCPGVDQIATCLHCETPPSLMTGKTELTQHCIVRAWSERIATTIYTIINYIVMLDRIRDHMEAMLIIVCLLSTGLSPHLYAASRELAFRWNFSDSLSEP